MEIKDNILHLLSEKNQALLKEEITLLQEFCNLPTIQALPNNPLLDTLEHIEELFLLVVVGEVKSGKSSFVNALLGQKICKEGVTPVTDKINILRYGETDKISELESFVIQREYPYEPLHNLNLVDTPGTNSLIREHQQITEKFIPRCDLVLFITSIDRPFTDSERRLLEFIKDLWGKKIIFILNKIDLKETNEVSEVLEYIKTNCQSLLHFEPLIFSVSSKQAYEGKSKGNPELLKQSHFAELEDYIFKTLSQEERLKLKLTGPVFTANKVLDNLLRTLQKEKEVIALDYEVLAEMLRILQYEERLLKQNYQNDLLQTKNLMQDFSNWGQGFLSEYLQLKYAWKIWRKNKIFTADEEPLHRTQSTILELLHKAWDKLNNTLERLHAQIINIAKNKFHHSQCTNILPEEEKNFIPESSKLYLQQTLDILRSEIDISNFVEKINQIGNKSTQRQGMYFGFGVGGLILCWLLGSLFFTAFFILLGFVILAAGLALISLEKKKSLTCWTNYITPKQAKVLELITQIGPQYIQETLPNTQNLITKRQSIVQQIETKNKEDIQLLENYKQKFSALDTKIKSISK